MARMRRSSEQTLDIRLNRQKPLGDLFSEVHRDCPFCYVKFN